MSSSVTEKESVLPETSAGAPATASEPISDVKSGKARAEDDDDDEEEEYNEEEDEDFVRKTVH